MYAPDYSRQDDPEKLRELIRGYPLATVITRREEVLNVSHLPLLLDETEPEKPILIGHLARANPQTRDFESGSEALAIFHGPGCYISPRWYEGKLNVPTWNYTVVHITGRSHATSSQRLIEILDRSVARFEAGAENPWRFSGNPNLPEEFSKRVLDAIVGFEIEMTLIEGKFKLSQNRNANDYEGAREGLLKEARDEMSRAVLALMPKELK